MLEIISLEVTPFVQNCRILYDASSPAPSSALVIDPGGDVPIIQAQLKQLGLACAEIWLTHSHIDHCAGVKKLKATTNAKLIGHPAESNMRRSIVQQAQMFGLPSAEFENCPEPDVMVQGGETLSFGAHEFKVLFTPGHSPGHVCFYCEALGLLLAGDTLFAGSIGRTDLPGGNYNTLMASIHNQILSLPAATRVLPGHGPDTTVGVEQRSNPFLQE